MRWILLISMILFSCATQKPAIKKVPDIDSHTPIYFFNDHDKFTLNGNLLYKYYSFGSTDSLNDVSSEIQNANVSTNSLFNYPLGKMDYSDALSPSISRSNKYLIKANDDFKIIKIRFNRDVDIDIVDLQNGNTIESITVSIPNMEYENEKYNIPWSQKDDSYFIIKDGTILKKHVDGKSDLIYTKEDMYDFNISPSEKYAMIFCDDSLHFINIKRQSIHLIKDIGRILGINRRFIRGMSWNENSNLCSFAEGWRIYIYNYMTKKLHEIKMDGKVFYIEWINNDEFIYVTGDYPSDLAKMRTRKTFEINKYSLKSKNNEVLHKRLGQSPLTIRPQISPSGKFLLFSEKNLNGPFQVKLMTLDGKKEKVISEGYLPLWGGKN